MANKTDDKWLALKEWERFLLAESHILRRYPELLFQQAINQPDVTLPAQKAEVWPKSDLSKQPFFIRINKSQQRSPCLMTLSIHTGSVTACAFSPDGRRIVSASEDETLIVWDADTGESLTVMTGHSKSITYPKGVNACDFSSDGNQVLSASNDCTLKIFDVRTGKELSTMVAYYSGRPFYACAFSPDGKLIVAGDYKKILYLWDVNLVPDGYDKPLLAGDAGTQSEAAALHGHDDSIFACTFSPDGSRILSGSADKTLILWDAKTRKEVATMKGHTNSVISCAFSLDGRHIVSGSANCHFRDDGRRNVGGEESIKIWDAKTGKEMSTCTGRAYSFSPDGRRIVCSRGSEIFILDVKTKKELALFGGHTTSVNACAFSPDGSRIVSGSSDNTLKIWDIKKGEELPPPINHHSGRVMACAFSPEGNRIVSGSSDNTLKIWDVKTGEELDSLKGHTSTVTCCSFSPDGKKVISGSWDKTLKLWDVKTGSLLASLVGHKSFLNACTFTPDGTRIVSVSDDDALKIWDAKTEAELTTISDVTLGVWDPVWALSPDGNLILWGSTEKILKILDVNTGEELPPFRTKFEIEVTACTFSPDGNRIVAAYHSGPLRIWDTHTGSELGILTNAWEEVSSCAFSPDGDQIIAGSRGDILQLWDATTGAELSGMAVYKEKMSDYAFSPDSRNLMTVLGRIMKLWDMRNGEQIYEYQLDNEINVLCWSPDGIHLAIGDNKGEFYILQPQNIPLGNTQGGSLSY